HEMLWYLAEATSRTFDPDTSHHVNELRMTIEIAMAETQQVLSLNLGDMHARVRSVLMC
ncbi:hypothetical protein ABIB51_004613, partial [Arthrobacter sp. UYCu712]